MSYGEWLTATYGGPVTPPVTTRQPLTCADCGAVMKRKTWSLPQGEARCHPCRRVRPAVSTLRARRPPTRPLVDACQRCGLPLEEPSRVRRYCSSVCAWKVRGSRRKPSTSARGYGAAHRDLRAASIDAAVGTPCVLCGEVMDDPARMHLDHTPDRSGYRGFAHDGCNVRDGARRAGAAVRLRRSAGA
jgi:hypothetical protein